VGAAPFTLNVPTKEGIMLRSSLDRRRAGAGRRLLAPAAVAVAAAAAPAAASGQFAGPQRSLPDIGGPSSIVFNSVDRQYIHVVDGGFHTHADLLSGNTAYGEVSFRVGNLGSVGRTNTDVAYNPQDNQFLIANGNAPVLRTADLFDADGTRRVGDIPLSPNVGDSHGYLRDLRYDPAVAYNASGREWLIAYTEETDDGASVVRATRLDAGGTVLSTGTMVADLGQRNDSPDLAYRPASGDYLLVWSAVDGRGASDVYVQRLNTRGDTRGAPRRLSRGRTEAGPHAGVAPAVAVNWASSEALVVWSDAFEIHGCRVDGRAVRRDRRLQVSSMGVEGDLGWADARAADPAVAYSAPGGEYLVVWSGVDPTLPGSPALNPQIVGQHLTRSAREVGPDDFAITTDMLESGDRIESGVFDMPSVAADSRSPRYLVSYWASYHPGGPGELVQFGRLLQTARADSSG
jgi:hypothetical protein